MRLQNWSATAQPPTQGMRACEPVMTVMCDAAFMHVWSSSMLLFLQANDRMLSATRQGSQA